MQNNWYIIYTKPKWEKKVAKALKRRKIENFLALQKKQTISFRRIKTEEEPLFENYVFVKIPEHEMSKFKKVRGVINLVYWKGVPAKIKNDEIEMLKDFIHNHDNISLEKTKIQDYAFAKVTDNNFRYLVSGNVLTIKKTVSKINLPSIGLTLVAKAETANTVNTDNSFGQKLLLVQS